MNKDDFDIFRHLKSSRNSAALELFRGLESREYGQCKLNPRGREGVEYYAEEQIVRKETLEEMRCEMPGLPRSTFLMVFSPDGQRAASTHGNHNIYVTDLRSGKNIKTLIGHPRTPWCIAFHPTCNQIVASGCLGGQVRIWDLSGGSEVWTSATQSVIASIAFHPNDRVLVIATFNELYFWDWSKPEPFVHCATNNPKEKVRYVAFDKLGHKLITGIANGPQTRWERVRAPVPVPRQERESPYRRRITQRLVSAVLLPNICCQDGRKLRPKGTKSQGVSRPRLSRVAIRLVKLPNQHLTAEGLPQEPRDASSGVPERERRIMFSYRNLVREYEQLVHRYLQLYRPPTMIDRGTDPMEPNEINTLNTSGTQTAENTSNTMDPAVPGPSGIKRSTPGSTETKSGSSKISSSGDPIPSTSKSEISSYSAPALNDVAAKDSASGGSYSKQAEPCQSNLPDKSLSIRAPSRDDQPTSSRASVIISAGSVPGSSNGGQLTESNLPTVSTSATSMSNTSPTQSGRGASGAVESPTRSYRSRLSTSTIDLPSPSSPSSITPSRIFRVFKRRETLIRGTQTSESRKHKSDIKGAESSIEKRMRTTSSGESSSVIRGEGTSSTDSSRGVEGEGSGLEDANVVDMEASRRSLSSGDREDDEVSGGSPKRARRPPVNVSNVEERLAEHNNALDGTSQEEVAGPTNDSVDVRNLNLNDIFDDIGAPPNYPLNLTTRNSGDLESHEGTSRENSGQPCSRYSQRFLEYIRANEQRFRELRRLIENDNRNANRVDSRLPSTSGLNQSEPSTSSTNRRNLDERLSNIRRTAAEEVRNRILPIIRSVPVQDRQELLRLFENSREQVRQRFRQIFLKRHCKRRLRVDSSTDSSSSDTEQNNTSSSVGNRPRKIRHDAGPSGGETSENVATTSEAAATTTTSTSSTSVATSASANQAGGRIRVRNFNTELEQLVTSLLAEIERSENNRDRTENSAESNAAGGDISGSQVPSGALGRAVSSARTRPTSRLQLPTPYSIAPPSPNHTFEGPQNLSARQTTSRETPTRDDPLRDLRDSPSSDPLLGDPLFSENSPLFSPPGEPLGSFLNTNTRPTNSPTYTHSSIYQSRRRLFSHRVSAFMPTRVNYTRNNARLRRHQYPVGSGRSGTRRNQTFALDELINYAERENSEEDLFTEEDFPPLNPENFGIGSAYSNIVQDLESSLNDVRNISSSIRPGETSNMLSSFSERLENIMTQSDTILRNLRSSMEMLPPNSELPSRSVPDTESWNFNDAGFYVRVRNEDTTNELNDLVHLNAVASDHTYPINPNSPQSGDNMSPLMTSLHLTISHIQRQARLLRRQVESIERIDRAMVEVAQLQLMRQLVIELVRHIRSLSGESRSTGMSSVRQMMAGTRISDSSPYDSPSEDTVTNQPLNLATNNADLTQPGTSSEVPRAEQNLPGPSSSSGSSGPSSSRPPKSTSRKTYPPSRFVRFARRRPHLMHWFSRRCLNRLERGARGISSSRPTSSRGGPQSSSSASANPQIFNYSNINSSTLSLMTRRLENLLTDQMRVFTRPQETPPQTYSNASVDLGEHILALRLHGCLLRMNRVLGNSIESNSLRNLRSESTAAVTQDGAERYGARHTLSLIVDGMSRHIEEIRSNTIPQNMRMQIHGVLAMSLLLTELLVLQVVDSVPPPSGMNLEPERESLTNRIDQMCTQMLQSRFSGSSQQLTRSLRLMRLTMRHAHRALDRTYNARRSAMMQPRRDTDRRQLLGSINRCLRTIHRRDTPRDVSGSNTLPPRVSIPITIQPRNNISHSSNLDSSSTVNTAATDNTEAWYSTINDLISRYSGNSNRDEEANNQPSTSAAGVEGGGAARERSQNRDGVSSNNDNSDIDDDPDWFWHRGSNNSTSNNNSNNNSNSSYNSGLYRTNNVNLVNNPENAHPPRLWNVPSVQVNDLPVSEPSVFRQRWANRQRFDERLAELRGNPRIGLFRPRFLHPLYASVNPFDADLDDPQREQIYDSDMITTVTPNHRIQAWDISNWNIPSISNSLKNVVVSECKIHNDASVDIAKDGTLLVTLLPSGGYLNVTNRLGVYSLRWETLGQCLYTTSFEQNAVSVSLSPLSRHLVVGFASRRVSLVPSDRWVMARIYKIEQKDVPGDRLPILRELEQSRESRINCIRWLPMSGQGLIYATNTGQLVVLS